MLTDDPDQKKELMSADVWTHSLPKRYFGRQNIWDVKLADMCGTYRKTSIGFEGYIEYHLYRLCSGLQVSSQLLGTCICILPCKGA